MNAYTNVEPLSSYSTAPIIIKNQWLGSDTVGVEGIALNPEIAKKLGWTYTEQGLFKWVNTVGEVMVESLWWKDGCIDLPPYERDCEVSEGFLVVASPLAATQILRLLKEPEWFLLVQRSSVSDRRVLQSPAFQFSEPFLPVSNEHK